MRRIRLTLFILFSSPLFAAEAPKPAKPVPPAQPKLIEFVSFSSYVKDNLLILSQHHKEIPQVAFQEVAPKILPEPSPAPAAAAPAPVGIGTTAPPSQPTSPSDPGPQAPAQPSGSPQ